MDIMSQMVDMLLHLGEYLGELIQHFGALTYLILFAVIFAETGFVITPFLPGDSLIFLAGAFAAQGYLNIILVYIVMLVAAILGDSINYWIGNKIGPRVFTKENSRVFNKKYLEKTHEFYEKYGAKTLIIARFVPIVRTFAPFVAGVGSMEYKTFFKYNVIGAFIWVTSLSLAGYFLGTLPVVKNNFEYAVFLIIGISLLPVAYEFIKARLEKRKRSKSTSYKEIKEDFKKDKY